MQIDPDRINIEDFEIPLDNFRGNLDQFKNSSILITGSTGFFGTWILLYLNYLNYHYDLNLTAFCISRAPEKFLLLNSKIKKYKWINWIKGDIRNVDVPSKSFDFVIHGATTSAYESFIGTSSSEKYSVVLDGTQNLLRQLSKIGYARFLYLSSGSVYDSSSIGDMPISEEHRQAPLTSDPSNALGNAKRAAESLCLFQNQNRSTQLNIARCFSFIGPGIPLDLHYAAGNFINDVLKGRDIKILGNPLAKRSYQYVSDAISWFLSILTSNLNNEVLNVGSDEVITIEFKD